MDCHQNWGNLYLRIMYIYEYLMNVHVYIMNVHVYYQLGVSDRAILGGIYIFKQLK
mgnify:CR=1 FL=1